MMLNPRDATVRCEAMHAFADSAQAAINTDDDAKLAHAIEGMAMTLLDLEQYRDRANPAAALIRAEQWLAENGREALDDGRKVVGEMEITPSREALALFLAAIDDDDDKEV
jgi:hypothetical protein